MVMVNPSLEEKLGPLLKENLIIYGLNWGDEGKGKLVDLFAEIFDVVVRYNGGPNAGHTIFDGYEQFILHSIPSGIRRGKICVNGNGIVFEPFGLMKEKSDLKMSLEDKFYISEIAHLITPDKRVIDMCEGKGKIGTTGRAIGPTYAAKANRTGLRFIDLKDEKFLRKKLEDILESSVNLMRASGIRRRDVKEALEKLGQQKYYNEEAWWKGWFSKKWFDVDAIYEYLLEFEREFGKYRTDVSKLLNRLIDEGKKVLFEGAQGTMLDNDFGSYPYVTSSNVGAAAAAIGAGVPYKKLGNSIGVIKAYTTRVGHGPFPTELGTEEEIEKEGREITLKDREEFKGGLGLDYVVGKVMRVRGGEYGATTGRPRRCGWFDAVIARRGILAYGADALAITKLDVLDGFETIKICTGYKNKVTGGTIEIFPYESDMEFYKKYKPIYEEVEGWNTSTKNIRDYEKLPIQAKKYVERLEQLLGVPVAIVSVGAHREETIFTEPVFKKAA